nr:hypothetical protein [Escherichia coli]
MAQANQTTQNVLSLLR